MEGCGILFDLDGTLLDTLADLTDSTNYALRVHGFPEKTLEQIRSYVGNGARNQIRLSLPEGAGEETIQAVLDTYKTYYAAHCQIKTRPYAGIPEALAVLRDRYPMAIVSNKPDIAVRELCARHFPGICARGEGPGCPRKPAPDMVWQAMAELGIKKCVYIGDSEVDVLTARNAGVPCVSVLWGFREKAELEAAGAERFCETPQTLSAIVEEVIHGK